MKKTLVALAVTAFAASASAVTVYEAEGSKIDFYGSARVLVEKKTQKVEKVDGVKKGNDNTKLRNQGTRFGVKVKHALSDDGFYALGEVQVRFKNNQNSGFGDAYAHKAYVGLGQKEFGQVTFGKQSVIADDVGLANDYVYGLLRDYVPTSSTSAIRYDYQGIEGLTLSANYNFAQSEENDGEALEKIKNGYGFGAVYEVNNWIFQGAFGRTHFKSNSADKIRANAFDAAIGYNASDVVLVGVDGGYEVKKTGLAKNRQYYVGPMVKVDLTDKSSVYANYRYGSAKDNSNKKTKSHGFLAGTDYKFHKNVVAFVEGKYSTERDHFSDGTRSGKTTEKAIGVGLRVNW
ncbi:porin [Mannheimia sp. ZY171111]|uniref:porin n=1 Tax=Mannheimia sp. ZY171111 TaxID=2679995 RepID=UPI001ADD74BB|nr:porin [Mannheimia sp. ZY171111]QTM01938.1 porin [Mannheimia sp. ZY171111]